MAGTPKLIVLSEQLRGKSFELVKDLHTVGRSEERDICIKDPTISTYHCDFIRTGSTYTIRDNNSTNGTRVNNVPITEQELQNSDILQIGGVEILYDCDDKSVTTVMRTQTGINLEGTDLGLSTVKKMDNFDPFGNKNGKKSGKSQKIVLAFVVLLVIVILGLVAFLTYIIFNEKTPSANGMILPSINQLK
jgi:pSer/pThr/pTyr-binding forkhead associated (FHA) protein